ncbi:MAG: holo-ACP synthase [Candidatus Coatesbacteria bacterium]
MISGLGVDSVEVGRFRKVAKRWGKPFLRRLFTARELDYCFSHANPYPSLAARFAAKEAVLKALDARALWKWHDMEVRRAESGHPSIALTGAAAKHAKRKKAKSFLISITHDAERATAVVLAVGHR